MGYKSLIGMETSSQVTNKLLLHKSLENSQSLLLFAFFITNIQSQRGRFVPPPPLPTLQ